MAQTKLTRITRPFIGGLVDEATDPRQALLLEDAIYPLGIACERGGWTVTGEADSLGGGVGLVSVMEEVVSAGGFTTPDLLVSSTIRVGVATSPARVGYRDIPTDFVVAGASYRLMRELFNGEALAFPDTGTGPILRFAANISAANGTFGTGGSFDKTQDYVTLPSLSASLVTGDLGRFITAPGFHGSRRIIRRLSASAAQIDEPFAETKNAIDGGIVSAFGVLALLTEVTTRGKASLTGSGSAITGVNTDWNASGPGFGVVRADLDFIAPIDGNDYGEAVQIDAVGSATSITATTTVPAFSSGDVAYTIGRPLVGKWGFLHRNQLYTGGVAWAPRRLQIAPPLWNGSNPRNGEFSYEVDIGRASLCAFEEVPNPDTAGALVGGMSLPSGNGFVASDRDAYIFYGAYPSITFDKVADFGAFSDRAILAVDDGAWFAGAAGVFEMRGNRPERITSAIQRRWTNLVDEGLVDVILLHQDRHLLVQVTTNEQTVTLVWDTASRTWPGTWSLPRLVGAGHSRVISEEPRLLASQAGDDRIADLSTCFVDHKTDITVTSNPGSFRARTADDVVGDLSVEREVKYVKLRYQLLGASQARLEVTAGPDVADNPTDVCMSLAPTTGEVVGEGYATPSTDVTTPVDDGLGVRTNRWDLDVFHDYVLGDAVTRLVLHEIEVLSKEYRLRDG